MKLITSPVNNEITNNSIKLYLDGEHKDSWNWQGAVLSRMSMLNYDSRMPNLIIYNPRREKAVRNRQEGISQIEWEYSKQEMSDIYSLYFCADLVQAYSLYDLGRNLVRFRDKFIDEVWSKRLIITMEEGYPYKDEVILLTKLATGLSDLVQIGDISTHVESILSAYNTINKLPRETSVG